MCNETSTHQDIQRLLDPVRLAVAAPSVLRGIPWRQHLKSDSVDVYVRVTSRLLWPRRWKKFRVFNTIDLASIDVETNFRRAGVFKSVLSELQLIAQETARPLYVENVMNEHLLSFFHRTPSFLPLRSTGGIHPPCFAFFPANAKPTR